MIRSNFIQQLGRATLNVMQNVLFSAFQTVSTFDPGGDFEGRAFGSVCLSVRVTQKLLLRLT